MLQVGDEGMMAKKKPAIEYPEDVIVEARLRRMKPADYLHQMSECSMAMWVQRPSSLMFRQLARSVLKFQVRHPAPRSVNVS